MRCLAKTHKPVGADGVPKSCPVVEAAKGLTTSIRDLLSDILEPLTSVDPERIEAQSTKELLGAIQKANHKVQEVNDDSLVLASMDVTALYPSIDQLGSVAIVRESFLRSNMQIKNVD